MGYKIGDKEIRYEFLMRNKDFFKSNIFVNEFGINSTNVVDLASFDFNKNIFYGFEIKSPRDNLDRLYKQLTSYITFFTFVYLVIADKHLAKGLEIIDNNRHLAKVGVISVTNDLEFKEIRQAKVNRPFFDLFIRNLELDDLRMICEEKGFDPEGNKKQLITSLKMHISMEEIYEGLHKKLLRHHVHICPYCGSNLCYNKRKNGEESRTFCYECRNEIPVIND